MRVKVSINECQVENEDGYSSEGVRAECSRCGHETESSGTGSGSRRRCLALMRDECPKRESNYYVDGEAG